MFGQFGIILFILVVLFEVNLFLHDVIEKRIIRDAERRVIDARIRKAQSIAYHIGREF